MKCRKRRSPFSIPLVREHPGIEKRQERFAFSSKAHGSTAAVIAAVAQRDWMAKISCRLTRARARPGFGDRLIGIDAGQRPAVRSDIATEFDHRSATRDASAGGLFGHDNLLAEPRDAGRISGCEDASGEDGISPAGVTGRP
jgi:hypothetical protein